MISQHVDTTVPEADRPRVWLQVQRQRLWRLRNAMRSTYHVDESPRILLLSAMNAEGTRSTLGIGERALDLLETYLPETTQSERLGKHTILCFDTAFWFRQYMRAYPGDYEHACGVCVTDIVIENHIAGGRSRGSPSASAA